MFPELVIVANGEFPTHPVPLTVLREARFIVACDGAIAHVPQADVVIGDGDSVPAEFRARLVQVDEQEDNDLTKAVRYLLEQKGGQLGAIPQGQESPLYMAFLACTGRREDHTLGNISLLMRYYRDLHVLGIMYTDYGFFTPVHGSQTFSSFTGQQVSIFNFSCNNICSEGLKWSSYAYDQWWQGTLNESLADHFTLDADGYYLVFQTYPR